jgi:hypothetical protein
MAVTTSTIQQTFVQGSATTLAAAQTAFNTALATQQAAAQTPLTIQAAQISHSVTAATTDLYIVYAFVQYATPYIPS